MQIIVKSKNPDLQKKLYDLGLNPWHTWRKYQETVINTNHDYLLVSKTYNTFCRISKIVEGENVINCGNDEDRFLKEIEKLFKNG